MSSSGYQGLAVTAAHALLNVDWAAVLNDRLPVAERKFHVAFIPVTDTPRAR